MRVLSLVEHLTRGDRKPDRPDEKPSYFDTNRVVAAVKGESFKGFSWITIGGTRRKLDTRRPDLALEWAAERLGPRIAREFPNKKVALVPIPGHACTSLEKVAAHRVCQLATRIAAWLGEHDQTVDAQVMPFVYWSRVVKSAHKQGGTRDPAEVLKDYRSADAPRLAKRIVVLVDDVVTTGARIYAAARLLENQGVAVAELAFAVARTVHVKGKAGLALPRDYNPWLPEPDDDWPF